MKNKIFLLIGLVMLLVVFSACGTSSPQGNENSSGSEKVTISSGFDEDEISVGDYITFGKYEQDNNSSNGKEDIEWLVLDKQDGKALLISKYALDCQQFNTSGGYTRWELCSLRNWLSSTFLDNAFSSAEQAAIPSVMVYTERVMNIDQWDHPNNVTHDKVFLLSPKEADKYFASNEARMCKPTAYAVAQGASKEKDNGTCWWWLREIYSMWWDAASLVDCLGSIYYTGWKFYADDVAVRPALWINLDS